MRRSCFILASALLAIELASAAGPDFSSAAIRADVTFLADDLLEGREPGTRGHEIAALYVAARFTALGLKPTSPNGWMQSVPLQEKSIDEAASAVTMSGPRGSQRWPQGTDAIIYASPLEAKGDLEAPLVFVGFGLDAPAQGFADYRGLDVRGKIVVVLTGTPRGTSSEIGAHLLAEKQRMAERRGAIGMLSISTRLDQKLFSWKRQLEEGAAPRVSGIGADGRPLAEAAGVEADVSVSPTAARALFMGAPRSLDEVLDEADRSGGRPKGFALPGRARIQWTGTHRAFASPNVLGLISGADPGLRDEVVVMMAHLDHVGERPAKNGDRIINGAMDNAAGVAVLLEVARAFAASGTAPRRSILFLAVTAEEAGLLGTYYFARNPPVALERIVGVVNLDMPILTHDFTDIIAFGAEHSTLGAVAAKVASTVGVRLSPDPMPAEGLFTRSDHYALVKKGIPALFLTTGFGAGGEQAWKTYLAEHYHQPSDDLSQPFNWEAAARFARINYLMVREIADGPARPRWYEGDYFGDAFAHGASRAAAPAH